MKLMHVIYFICLAINPAFLYTQMNTDSLKQVISRSENEEDLMLAYNDYAFQQYKMQADTAIYFANLALEIALERENENEITGAYNVLGLSYQVKGLYNLSLENFKKALLYNQQDLSDMGRVSHNMALTHKLMKNNTDALKQELNAIKLFEAAKDSLLLCTAYQTIGNIYRNLGEYEEAEKFIIKAIQIGNTVKEFGNNSKISVMAGIYSDYGNLFQMSGQLYKAIEMHELCISMLSKSGDTYNKAIAYENLGDDYVKLKRFPDAIKNFTRAKELMEQVESSTDIGYELMKIAETYKLTGDYNAALLHADEALTLFVASKADGYRMDIYKLKYEIYNQQQNTSAALKNYELYNELKDSLNLEAQQNELIRIKTEYETTQKEQQIILLEAENTLKDKEKEQQIIFRNIAILIIGLLLLFGLMLLNRFRIRQQVKQLQMRNEIAMDLHDEVGSSLSSIKLLSEIANAQQHDQSRLQEVLNKIITNAGETAEKMHDIIWMINPKHDQLENITDRMERFLTEMCAARQIKYEFIKEFDRSFKLDMHQQKNLLLIFKEAVNNAVKYGDGDLISVCLALKNKMLAMVIADNGKGFNISSTQAGNGLYSMQQRANELKGNLQIKSAEMKGTEIKLELEV